MSVSCVTLGYSDEYSLITVTGDDVFYDPDYATTYGFLYNATDQFKVGYNVTTPGTYNGTLTIGVYHDKECGAHYDGEWYEITIPITITYTASCSTSPTVTAGSNSSVRSTTATVSCSSGISSLGSTGCAISSYGFVIGTATNPAIGGSGVTTHQVGTTYTSTGVAFSKDLTGLTANTKYYVRPYATNGNGTSYGTETSFTTLQRYAITYYKNDGSGANSTEYKDHGISYTISSNKYSRDHYTLSKWHTLAAGTGGTDYAKGASYSTDAALNLYAVWQINTHSLHWYKNADDADALTGTYTDGNAIEYGATVTKPNNPTRTGYTFSGWSETSSGSTTTPVTTMPDADKAYYAIWTANEYSVHFDANHDDAEGSMDNQDFTYGVAQALTSCGFTNAGYYFKGWATSDDGDVVYTDGQSVSNLSSTDDAVVDLYAVWGTYEKYVFACVDISVGLEDSKKVLITSRNGMNIMAVNKLLVTTDGAVDGHTVDISSDAGLKFYKKVDGVYKDLSVAGNKLTTPLTNQAVYVSYNPTSAGTGAITAPTFTIKCEGQSKTFNTSGEYVKVRNLPDAVAIAAKIGGTWHALSADITSSTTPKDISIYTSTVDGVLKAYGSTTDLSYKLWPVKTTTGSADRFGTGTGTSTALGDRLRFAGKNDKGLTANNNESSNKYNINNYAVIDAIDDDPAAPYEWKVTTTEADGQFVYTLQTDQTNNTRYLRLYNGRWGTYLDGKGIDSLYLLPVAASALVEMEAFEWGTSDVVVRYSPAATPVVLSKVTVGNTDISAPTASMTNIGGDLWKLSGLSGLTSKPSEQFVVSLTENGSAKQGLLQIPFIVTGDNTTEQSLRTSVGNKSAIYNNVDVVIRSGGKLITAYDLGHFANLYIYPGGKAVVSNNMTFGTIFMRGGYSFLDNKATYQYPDLCVKSGTISSDSLVYDMYVDNRIYYKFSMPRDVTLRSVTDETGSEDFPVWVKHYDGAKRASGAHVNGWEWYGDEEGQESFKAGVGYEITAKPKVSGRPLAIIRFPIKRGDITSDANDTAKVAVTNYGKSAYDSGDLAANNVGWNLVGNPYLTAFKATSDTSMIIDKSYEPADVAEGETWDGTYKWVSSPARFVTVPYDMQNDFHHEYVKNCTIPAFSAFFIQVVESGIFKMAGTRTQAAAPWRYDAAQKSQPEMHLDVLLHGNNEAVEAKAGLIIHDKYEGGLKDFEDVEQWFVDQNEQKTYTFANGTALAYNLLNEEAAMQIIPMGYIATVAGERTYSLDESNDMSGLEHLWLTDYMTGVTTDLLVHGYSFTTEAGRFDDRFAISATLNRDEVATEIVSNGDDSQLMSIGIYHDGNTLTLRGLPENSSAYVYDMTGKLITSGKNLHNVASFNIAAQGVYNIRVVDGEKAVTLRCVLQ